MAGEAVRVAGLKELMVALRTLAPEIAKELNKGLRVIVREAEAEARVNADRQGFTPPGRSGRGVGNLIGQIRSGVTMTKGYVADSANRDGYYYPSRFEYQDGGERSFIRPTIDNNRDKIYASIAAIVEETLTAFNAA